jgi:hypothetical protein
MHDALFVRRGKTLGDLGRQFCRFPGREWAAGEVRSKRLARNELSNCVTNALVLPDVEEGHDVRVREGGDGPRFLLEPADALGIRSECGGKYLDRDISPEPRIAGAIDLAHAAAAERRHDLVRAQA